MVGARPSWFNSTQILLSIFVNISCSGCALICPFPHFGFLPSSLLQISLQVRPPELTCL
jgi:hypothetical protein